MKVLVVGGNGFIGSYLTDHLLRNGHSVRVYDNNPERYRPPLPNVDYRIANLSNLTTLWEALLDIEIVFYLASSSVPSTSNVSIKNDIAGNLNTIIDFLDLLVKRSIKRLVYFSSGGAIYGDTQLQPISEDSPTHPISSYGIMKLTIEKYLSLYERLYGIESLIVRPSNPYGPRQGHFIAQGVISTFLRNIAANDSITVFGSGSSVKDYIYVEDLVKLVYQLVLKGKRGVYNIGSAVGNDVLSIISLLKKVTSMSPEINFIESKTYDVNSFVLDTRRLTDAIGSQELTGIEDGIRETWRWIESNHKNFKS